MREKIPLRRAFIWIMLWTCAISGTSLFAFLYYEHLKAARSLDSKYTVQSIVQCRHGVVELPTHYLAELLHLSQDAPVNLHRLHLEELNSHLLACPLIKKAEVRQVNPSILWIDYMAREPVMRLIDRSNTLMDLEGALFPELPFFHNLSVPKVYIGIEPGEGVWGQQLRSKEALLALELVAFFNERFPGELKHLDVSHAYFPSCGNRSVVAILGRQGYFHVLRLTSAHYVQEVARYRILNAHLMKGGERATRLFDFRLPQLAYFSTLKSKG